MLGQRGAAFAEFVANYADKVKFSLAVILNVSVEVTFLCKGFLTHITGVLLFLCVRHHVDHHRLLVLEFLSAEAAQFLPLRLPGLLAAAGAAVKVQLLLVSRLQPTGAAGQTVRGDQRVDRLLMFLQGGPSYKLLSALKTLIALSVLVQD